jgi:hypothetical protein
MVYHGGDHEPNAWIVKEFDMSLIDKYVAEVGRHLPEKDRSDIENEIRTMVDDMIEERGRSAAEDEKIVAETLEQIGDPKLLAARYAPPKRHLIGPEWYEGYIIVLQRILFTALPIVAVITFILSLSNSPLDFVGAVGDAVGNSFSVGTQILFWVTLVFVLLERSGEKPDDLPKPGSRQWTVDQLPALPSRRQISVGETVMNIAMLLFLLIWIALPTTLDLLKGTPANVPFLHPNLWSFWLPLFFILMALTLIHEVFKLKIGNWTPALTITNVILGIASIIYIVALVTTQDVINPEFLSMLDQADGFERVRESARWSVNISAAIIVGIYVWSMVDSIRKARQLKSVS